MGKTAAVSPPDAINSYPKKTINAKEFLACFRERPADFYLLEKFGIKPNHLRLLQKCFLVGSGWSISSRHRQGFDIVRSAKRMPYQRRWP